MAVVTMVPAVVMTPMVTTEVPIMADASRTIIGVDDAAAAIGVVVAGGVGRVVVAAIAVEVAAMMMEVWPIGIMRTLIVAATAMEYRSRATAAMENRAAPEHPATTVERGAATTMESWTSMEAATAAVEAATSVEATAAMETATAVAASSPAMTSGATHLNRQGFSRCWSHRCGAGADRRHCRCRPTRRARQHN